MSIIIIIIITISYHILSVTEIRVIETGQSASLAEGTLIVPGTEEVD